MTESSVSPSSNAFSLAGRFDLLEEIGSGSSGTVYRARTRTTYGALPPETEVAIKFLRQDRGDRSAALAQMQTEAAVGRAVNSPHVCRIHGFETLSLLGAEVSYLVMEYVRGRTLRQFLDESGPAVEDLARRIGLDAARGLEALHRKGIVHRDLKPENLVLTPEGTVKIVDLGLARGTPTPGLPSSGGFFGSLSYAAPEVLRGKPAEVRSDLYSLGIVLYEVATGRHPFRLGIEGDADAMLHAHLEQRPPRPSHHQPRITAFLETLILELLAKEADARPDSARVLALVLEQGEASRWWQGVERSAPAIASQQRVRKMRRFAPTSFVGRAAERRILDRAFREARAGRGTAIRLTGPEGIGRRRLLDECCGQWLEDADDVVFLGGEAEPGATRTMGQPFTTMLLDWFLRGDALDSPRAGERLRARIQAEGRLDETESAQLAQLIEGGDPGSSPQVRADRIVRALLHATDDDRTLVLRVDRPERMDTTAELVLGRLVEAAATHRLLVLLVTGTDQERFAFDGVTLRIEGLPKDVFVAFGGGLFAAGEVPNELLDDAHATLSGSPGNLLEALESLAQQRLLEGGPGRYVVRAALPPFRPAAPLLQRVRARVAGLPEAQRHVLQVAAVLGLRSMLADVVALSGQSELEVLQAISVFQGRIVRAEQGLIAFRHADFRGALLEMVPPDARRRLHRMAGWMLEDRGAPPLEVGLQLSHAKEHQACLAPLLEGLARLVRAGSRRASLRVAERIRVHLNALPRSRENLVHRLRYLQWSAQVHGQAEHLDRAIRDWRKAYRIAKHLDSATAQARALVGLAGLAQGASQYLSALQFLDQCEDLLLGREDDESRLVAASAFGLHARVLGYLGSADDALAAIRAGLDVVPEDDDAIRPHLLVDLARLEALRYRFTAAQKHLERAATVFQDTGDPIGLLRLELHRGHLAATLRDDAAAIPDLESALRRARSLRDDRVAARAWLFLGQLHAWAERRDDAIPALQRAKTSAARGKDRLTQVTSRIELRALDVRDEQDDALESDVLLLGVPAPQAALALLRADELRAVGDRAGAEASVESALQVAREFSLPLRLYWRVLIAAGQESRARHLIDEIAERLPAGAARRRFVAAYS